MNAQLSVPEAVDVDALGDQIAETAAHIDAATHTLLGQIRAFDGAEGWHRQGALSCAHWLNWRIGLNLGAAREKVRVAGALGSLPLIDDALRRGEVSYSKVRAMTRVATEQNEADLLEMARFSTAAQLERICRLTRQVQSPTAEKARASEDLRWVSQRTTDDGMVVVQIQVTPEEAAHIMEAIRVSAETSGEDLAGGAVAMAESVLRGESVNRTPVDVTLQVDASTLAGHLPDGTGIDPQVVRRLCCDAGVAPLLEDEEGNRTAGRKTRTIPASMKRALVARDAGCRFPGCTRKRVDGHRMKHWADGGETSLDNLLCLCRRHHRYVHEYGFEIARAENGAPQFLDPSGVVIPAAGLPSGADILAGFAWRAGRNGWSKATPECNGWDGRPPDYGLAVGALLQADPESSAPTAESI